MDKILLLGGSAQQIPAIEHAKKLGCYTVLCDYLPDNPGQHHADKFYCVSAADKEAVLEVARNERVAGVVAYASDPAAPAAAYAAEKLGLPGQPFGSVRLLTHKDEFRAFLKENNFHTPKAKGYFSADSAKKDIGDFRLPVLIKPVDSSGSKGISKLKNIDEIETHIEYALSYSRSKRFIVEEFVEKYGYQVAGDGFSVDGKLVFRCFGNDHFDAGGINPFVPVSASFPYNMPERIHDKIHNEIQRALGLLGMRTGAYNFDIRIDKDENVYLMEIGPRNGGNFIPQVIRYATGLDMIEYTIKAAMGERIDDIRLIEPKGFWSYYVIHSPKAGLLKEINIDESVKRRNIVESHMNYKLNDRIPAFTGANCSIGIMIMKFGSINEMLYMLDNSQQWINVEVIA